ncbi:GGDEF domain-containing protein [Streptomyces sp. NPDC001941]|uniref:GGDEF domain-containing protein n=1 Tax=Streptomyces sp. NPDC001941 TaxID=3154659 RepID=UPI0033301EA3
MSDLLAMAALPTLGWILHAVWLTRQLNTARRDPLTGLVGRDAFTRQAQRALRRTDVSVVLVDVDDFKSVNDTHGHAAGDAVLSAIGRRLDTWCRAHGGFAARLGGDEFTAVVPLDAESATDLARALTQPVTVGGTALDPSTSIGFCGPDDRPGAPLSVRLRAADEAMYAAKSLGAEWRRAAPHSTHPTIAGRRAGRRGTHSAMAH